MVVGENLGQTAMIYDPTTRIFASTGSLNIGRTYASATLLPDGRVLVAGGQEEGPQTVAVAEIYDPATGAFRLTSSLNQHRSGHAAVVLPDRRVVIVGGNQTTTPGFGICLGSVELYDPDAGKFDPTAEMQFCRSGPRAVILNNGGVLISGGSGNKAELFNPETGTFSAAGDMTTVRSSHTATLLPDGQVLLAGGSTDTGPVVTNSAELYDPDSGTFRPTTSMNSPRQQHTATLLPDGQVLVIGGYEGYANLSSAELWAPTRASDPTAIAAASPNLLLYLPFDGDIADHSGSSLDTVEVGSLELVPGIYGQAAQFDGSGASIDIPGVADLTISDELTLEFWVNMADWQNPYSGSAHIESIASLSTLYTVHVNFDTWVLGARLTTEETGPSGINLLSRRGQLQPGQWRHIALVYGSADNVAVLYVDGDPVDKQFASGRVPPNNSNPFRVGTWFEQNQAFAGLVDELRLYNVALARGLIKEHARLPSVSSGPTPTPTATPTATVAPTPVSEPITTPTPTATPTATVAPTLVPKPTATPTSGPSSS